MGRTSSVMMTIAAVASTFGLLGCSRCSSEEPARGAPAVARGAITVVEGQTTYTLQPYDNGYRVVDGSGQRVASLRVHPGERVKAKDPAEQEITQAGRREYGFKLKDADETTVFKARRVQGGFDLEREDGSPLGQVRGATAVYGPSRISAAAQGGAVVIQRDGAAVGTVSGPVTPEAAVYLGLPGLSLYHRLTAMIFALEVG